MLRTTLAVMPDGTIQIGEVARRLDLSLNTIRHWHEAGLAPPAGRSPGGFRLYTVADIERLAFIKRFRPLGFGLDEIREVLAARDALATLPVREPAALIARLERYIEIANDRCAAIRADLVDAEAFLAELRHDVDTHQDLLEPIA
jgi:DNA-binding transcriptional MerR regulator